MPNPEFTSVDTFIKSSLGEAPQALSDQEKHQWTFIQFVNTVDMETQGKKLTGWQKANRGDVEDKLNPVEIIKLTSFAKEFTGKGEVSLCEAIDIALISFRNSKPISLEQRVFSPHGQVLGLKKDFVADTYSSTAYQEACDNFVSEKFQQLASECLSSIELKVLELRQNGIIQKDVADQLGLSNKKAVAWLEQKAIKKLRKDSAMQQLLNRAD